MVSGSRSHRDDDLMSDLSGEPVVHRSSFAGVGSIVLLPGGVRPRFAQED